MNRRWTIHRLVEGVLDPVTLNVLRVSVVGGDAFGHHLDVVEHDGLTACHHDEPVQDGDNVD
jgi:hypothetical protein